MGFDFLHVDHLDPFAGQPCQLTLKITNASLTGIEANKATDRAFLNHNLTRLHAVFFHLAWDQMTLGNLDLFVFRIAANTNDFHTIQQRLWHTKRIRGG